MSLLLNNILRDKHRWLAEHKARQPLACFRHQVMPSRRCFYDALRTSSTAYILECKKASPSKGLLRADFDPAAIATLYRDEAAAVSVLTDAPYFQGCYAYLQQVSEVLTQPVLCKDFIIDPWQIYMARRHQADAILLMLSVLDDQQYRELAGVAHRLQMGVLTEVICEEELQRAIALGARVIGINNRNLHDLSIDLNRTRRLAPQVPAGITLISESGIHSHATVRQLRPFVDGFLIGSALMREADLRTAIRRIVLGENKICGLTRAQDAVAAWQAGAIYGGLIFAEDSPRRLSPARAQELITAAPLNYVGVFRNQPLSDIVTTARRLSLHAVQLHGDEDKAWITRLRAALPEQIHIWKALSVTQTFPTLDWPHVDRYVLDNGRGGSGRPFDWSLLAGQQLSQVMLAGGLNEDNCIRAANTGCAGLDFNSGVELTPGVKDASGITAIFHKLRI